MLSREATSETYGPRVYLYHINLLLLSYFLCFFTLPFVEETDPPTPMGTGPLSVRRGAEAAQRAD